MIDTTKQKILDTLAILNTAVKNIRFYPPNSLITTSTIDKLYQTLLNYLATERSLILAEADKTLLVGVDPLSPKDHEKPYVIFILDIMLSFGIQSITFHHGLEKWELIIFLENLAKNPDMIDSESDLPQIIQKNHLTHISVDEKVFVLRSKNEQSRPGSADASNEAYVPGYVHVLDDQGGETKSDQDQFLYLQKKIESLLSDSEKGFLNKTVMESVLQTMAKFVAQDNQENVEAIIDRLLENMQAQDEKVRDQAARALVEIIESFSGKQKTDLVKKIDKKLLNWIKSESLATPSYQKIHNLLQDLVDDYIGEGNFSGTIPILEVFNNIRTGNVEKNDTIHQMSEEFINFLATKEHLDILLNIFKTGDQLKQAQAGETLIRLGDDALKRLLDLLREQTDSNERVRIMRLIISAGKRAMPFVRDRISKDQPWYYLRNMAYILGHIGDENSARVMQTLLTHDNNKVRLEALKSISRTGGQERCPLFLAVLPQVDQKFMINIIDALGNTKCTEATSALVAMLEDNPAKDKETRTLIEERICNALGVIGSLEAIPALSRIVESKSFLGISRYPEKVKDSAGRALAAIKRR